jgi:maltooligosyltrehalose trehalohydrolase
MGEEYGEKAPFLYFVSHSDPALIEAVRAGRLEEFAAFNWPQEPPDPQDEVTFLRTKLDHSLRKRGQHKKLLDFYRELIKLRTGVPALASMSKERMETVGYEEEGVLFVRRWEGKSEVCAVFNLSEDEVTLELPFPSGSWRKLLDSGDRRWDGPGSGIPGKLRVDGEAALTLPATRLVLFAKENG